MTYMKKTCRLSLSKQPSEDGATKTKSNRLKQKAVQFLAHFPAPPLHRSLCDRNLDEYIEKNLLT